MARFTLGSLAGKAALIGALVLGGCGLLPEQADETSGWNAQKLYSEAKLSMSEGGYDRAIQMFEKLEARYPYGRFAQQAQIEVAYAYYKQGEQALSLAAAVASASFFLARSPADPERAAALSFRRSI